MKSLTLLTVSVRSRFWISQQQQVVGFCMINWNSDNCGMIGITEPRRVAAISMAQRVALELGMEFGKQIGYQVSCVCWL